MRHKNSKIMKAAALLSVMFLSLSFMGCLEPEDKRSVIPEEEFGKTRLVVSEEQLSQFPYSLDPIRNFTVLKPDNSNLQTERIWAVYGTEMSEDHNYGGNCCEHYLALSLMEMQAKDKVILDANGNDRFKNGIYVNPFDSDLLSDIADPSYNAAYHSTHKLCEPNYVESEISMQINPDMSLIHI